MSCCGRTPAAEIRRAIRRLRGWRWACSTWAPGAPRIGGWGASYRDPPRVVLRLHDGLGGRHPSCTAKWSGRRSDKRGLPTH
jgi:hypothetical protein